MTVRHTLVAGLCRFNPDQRRLTLSISHSRGRIARLITATLLLAGALALDAAPRRADAAALTFVPVADAYTRSDLPDSNFGYSTTLMARGGSTQVRRSFLRFDVRVPADTLVTRATLRLYATTSATSSGVDVRSVDNNTWNERTLTHNNAPVPASTVIASARSYASGTYVSFDITSLVRGGGLTSVAFTTQSTANQAFSSREYSVRQPQLVVQTSPTTTSKGVLFGVSAEGVPWNMNEVEAFQSAAGKRPSLIMWYQDFAHFPDFDPSLVQRVLDRGAVAMLTWEPWDYTGGANQPFYALGRIIDGTHDTHIRRWASQIAAWNKPLFLRFAHEMNGTWNSWSEGVNGNLPGEYVAAWRHVREIFRAVGATNVTWVWSPNVVYSNSPPIAPYYPGDAYVDRVALDGYNWGSHFSYWQAWLSFEEIFGPGLAQLRSLTSKPVMVAEVASTELGGDKSAWIENLFSALKNHPEIVSFTWFNHNKETDWRIQSSPGAQAAFASGVSDPRYIAATP